MNGNHCLWRPPKLLMDPFKIGRGINGRPELRLTFSGKDPFL